MKQSLADNGDNNSDLPSPTAIATNLENDVKELAARHNIQHYYTQLMPVLDSLAVDYIVHAFIELGFTFIQDKSIKNSVIG